MNLVLDANILVRLIVGRRAAIEFAEAQRRGIAFSTTSHQLEESRKVLVKVFGLQSEEAIIELWNALAGVTLLEDDTVSAAQDDARVRLHRRAQPDWPVLAAAISTGAGIWSDDRDFFGVGVPVWSSTNISYAEPSITGPAKTTEAR
jgi:predicted nucleic acid-binding protein